MKSKNNTLTLILILALVCVPSAAFAAITFSGNLKIKGTLSVTGTFSKGSGHFLIDHPLDPANKLLYHTFVESPDVKNIYDGIATLDKNGEVLIQLPSYFDALNRSARYQFFALSESMPNLHIKEEESNNKFVIGGGVPGGRISWQITGIRHDAFIKAHPLIVEVDKGPGKPAMKGECLYEPLCK